MLARRRSLSEENNFSSNFQGPVRAVRPSTLALKSDASTPNTKSYSIAGTSSSSWAAQARAEAMFAEAAARAAVAAASDIPGEFD